MRYVVNSPTPIIETAPEQFYALQSGIWFVAPSPDGPWTVATSVPDAIYGIPPASPLHYVTYVDVYGATPEDVYVGYTPGYLGSVVAPDGVVVYGTGYDYQPWIGTEWYPPPVTYGVAAEPVYNPAVGWAYGTALGLTTAALADSWDNNNHNDYYAPYYHGYPCCGSTSAHVYGQYGDTYSSGTEKWYSNSNGNVGRSYSGSYTDYRTGTTGNVSASQNYNEHTGETTDTGQPQLRHARGHHRRRAAQRELRPAERQDHDQRLRLRHQPLRRHGGRAAQHQLRRADRPVELRRLALGHRRRRQHGNAGRPRARPAAANRRRAARPRPTTRAPARPTRYDRGEDDGQRYAGSDGNVYRSSGDGWQQHSSDGWQAASGDTGWADREQQARADGADRFGAFSGGGWDRFGGGFGDRFGGDRWGDGGGFGRFGGGGFGGGRFGGWRR